MAKKKQYFLYKGKLCSGFGIYPNGERCGGCMDCKGKFIKKLPTKKQIDNIFNKTHALIKIKKK